MPRLSQRSQDQSEPMEVSQTSTVDQSVISNPLHVTFIRCLLLNRAMTEEEMIATYLQVFPDDPQSRDFRTVLEEISESLLECKIKIHTANCEITNSKYYLVIPSYFRPTQVWPSLLFKETELNFIKTLISEIIVSDVGLVTLDRVVRKHKFIEKSDARKVFEKLLEENYLVEPRDGKYALSVLALSELEPYFHHTYKDNLKMCVFCKRAVFFGGFCQNCKRRGHFSCLTKFKESMKNRLLKCPSCNQEWNRTGTEGNLEEILDYEDEDDE